MTSHTAAPVDTPTSKLVAPLGGRRAWAIWTAAVSVYVLAVFHRTSLGVAGILAAQRFGISSGQLATFAMVQLLVYAVMQVPVGAMLDQFGSKKLLAAGTLTMTLGQAWFAFASTFAQGIGARVLVGMGDAMIFVCVLRIAALWFPVRRAPMVTQITGFAGQLGSLLAAGPLAVSLHSLGWRTTYLGAAAFGVVLGVVMWFVVIDSPTHDERRDSIRLRAVGQTLAQVWREPGTKLGLWAHFTTQFSMNVFMLLWGFPFLTKGQGLSEGAASTLLSIMVVTIIVTSPLMGTFTARFPHRRSVAVFAVVLTVITLWTIVLLWPGRAPLWLLVLLCIAMAFGGPGSMVGFDVARSFNPAARIGSANGIVNVGGYVASVTCIVLIGLVLDHVAPGGPATYDVEAFRKAMSVQYLVWALGLAMMWHYRRRTHDVVLADDDYAHLRAGVSRRRTERAGADEHRGATRA